VQASTGRTYARPQRCPVSQRRCYGHLPKRCVSVTVSGLWGLLGAADRCHEPVVHTVGGRGTQRDDEDADAVSVAARLLGKGELIHRTLKI